MYELGTPVRGLSTVHLDPGKTPTSEPSHKLNEFRLQFVARGNGDPLRHDQDAVSDHDTMIVIPIFFSFG